jgi:hypothetical protein
MLQMKRKKPQLILRVQSNYFELICIKNDENREINHKSTMNYL